MRWVRLSRKQWEKTDDFYELLFDCRVKSMLNDRKIRLFLFHCDSFIWNYLDGYNKALLELSEDYADGLIGLNKLKAYASINGRQVGIMVSDSVYCSIGQEKLSFDLPLMMDVATALNSIRHEYLQHYGSNRKVKDVNQEVNKKFCDIFREMVNPFNGTDFFHLLTWNDGTIVKLANNIYQERKFGTMPILADALEEAGCIDAEVLNHCREQRKHIKGCWVLDKILEKEPREKNDEIQNI